MKRSHSKSKPDTSGSMLLPWTDIVSTNDTPAQPRLPASHSLAACHRETNFGWVGVWRRRRLDEWPGQAFGTLSFDQSVLAS